MAGLTEKKKPWFKFYPSDWRGDAKLRMCSIGARGLWAEMLCIMHEAEPYGHLLINGHTVAPKQLASLAGIPFPECARYLVELELAGVPSRTPDGILFSRRMVRDKAKADIDAKNGKGGGNPKITEPVKGRVNPPDKGEVKAYIPEARNDDADDAGARPSSGNLVTPEAIQLTDKLLKLAGHDPAFYPPGWGTAAMRVQAWLNEGWQADVIVAVVKSASARKSGAPASSVTYFEKAIAEEIAKQARPLPVATIIEGEKFNVQGAGNRGRPENFGDIAKRHIAAGITFGPKPTGMPARSGDAEGESVVRLLPESGCG